MHTPPRPSRRTLLTGLALASLAPALAACSGGDDSLARPAGNAGAVSGAACDG